MFEDSMACVRVVGEKLKKKTRILEKRFSFVFRNSNEFLECDYLCSKCDTYHTRNSACYDE